MDLYCGCSNGRLLIVQDKIRKVHLRCHAAIAHSPLMPWLGWRHGFKASLLLGSAIWDISIDPLLVDSSSMARIIKVSLVFRVQIFQGKKCEAPNYSPGARGSCQLWWRRTMTTSLSPHWAISFLYSTSCLLLIHVIALLLDYQSSYPDSMEFVLSFSKCCFTNWANRPCLVFGDLAIWNDLFRITARPPRRLFESYTSNLVASLRNNPLSQRVSY